MLDVLGVKGYSLYGFYASPPHFSLFPFLGLLIGNDSKMRA